MKYPTLFWALCACTLFALLMVSLRLEILRKNHAFAAWLGISVAFQFLAACALALPRRPEWFELAGKSSGVATAILAMAVVLTSAGRRACPVNHVLFSAFSAMLFFDAAPAVLAWLNVPITPVGRAWLRNVSFYIPALYMLLMFSWLTPEMRRLASRLRIPDSRSVAWTLQISKYSKN